MKNNFRQNRAPTAAASRHCAAQWNALRRLLNLSFQAVNAEKRPLDRVLGAFWRDNRCYGARDRRLFSETLFAAFRFWGLLRHLVAPEEAECFARGEAWKLPEEVVARMVIGAWLLEGYVPGEMLGSLAERYRIAVPAAAFPGLPPGERLLRIVRGVRAAWRPADQGELTLSELLPGWAVERLRPLPGYEAYLETLASRPWLWLRCQTSEVERVRRELESAGLTVRSHPRVARALAVTGGAVNLYTLELYRQGLIEVQDLASQAIALAAAPRRGQRWFDACAGAGGKTLALAELMERTGTVVAGDIRAYKLEDLRKRSRRAGFPNIMTRPWDGKKISGRQAANFDGVLVDAPCSCSGVWRRNPDGRWSTSAADVDAMFPIQREVLHNAAPAVRPGGVLIYATCSIFPSENEAVATDFLAAHPEFTPEAFAHPLTGAPVASGMLAIAGGEDNSDSMFVARFRRR